MGKFDHCIKLLEQEKFRLLGKLALNVANDIRPVTMGQFVDWVENKNNVASQINRAIEVLKEAQSKPNIEQIDMERSIDPDVNKA